MALLQYWAILHGLISLYINKRLSVMASEKYWTIDMMHQSWDVYVSSAQA